MSATSTKCTVSFNSNETNDITPIAYTKEELIALNEEIKNTVIDELKMSVIDSVYPVGSIYMSTEDDTVEKVENKFGGTWVKYAEDTTLVSASSNYPVNTTGGSSTVTLSTSNLPSHSHVIPALTVSSWSGSHSHKPYNGGYFFNMDGNSSETTDGYASGSQFNGSAKSRMSTTASTTITVSGQKTTASNTTTCTNCSGSSFSVQNPYTAVYMYKRTA
jgi:microcystin-dependent protein